MNIDPSIRFGTIDWDEVAPERHEGITGYALWKVPQVGGIRLRLVEYSPGYEKRSEKIRIMLFGRPH